jgi:hypothetical protein
LKVSICEEMMMTHVWQSMWLLQISHNSRRGTAAIAASEFWGPGVAIAAIGQMQRRR